MPLEKQAPVGVTLIKPTSVDSPIVHHARNYMDHEPSLPPPLYPPEEVAEAILYAAVHPRREIYVGGPGKAISTFRSVAPSFYESLVPAISSFERRSEMPQAPSADVVPRVSQFRTHPGPENTGSTSFSTSGNGRQLFGGAIISAPLLEEETDYAVFRWARCLDGRDAHLRSSIETARSCIRLKFTPRLRTLRQS